MIGNQKGHTGEELACRYLEKNGYVIDKRNYHSAYGEIDIICRKDGFIVFVEVKLRKKNATVSAAESVSKAKQRKIINTSALYLQDNNITLQPRFDVIAITQYAPDEYCVEHIEAAFDAQNIFY